MGLGLRLLFAVCYGPLGLAALNETCSLLQVQSSGHKSPCETTVTLSDEEYEKQVSVCVAKVNARKFGQGQTKCCSSCQTMCPNSKCLDGDCSCAAGDFYLGFPGQCGCASSSKANSDGQTCSAQCKTFCPNSTCQNGDCHCGNGDFYASTDGDACPGLQLSLLQASADPECTGPHASCDADCSLRASVYSATETTENIDKRWQELEWRYDSVTKRNVKRDPQDLQTERISVIRTRISMYYTNYKAGIMAKKDELHKIQEAKQKRLEADMAFMASLMEFSLGFIFCPAIGAFKASKFVTKALTEKVAQETAKQFSGLFEKTSTKIIMAGAKAALKPLWLESMADKFLESLAHQQNIMLDNIQLKLGMATESELYACFVMFDPTDLASQAAVSASIDEVYNVWDLQINGLGWQWEKHCQEPCLHSLYWHGIVEVDWDIEGRPEDFKYYPYDPDNGDKFYLVDPEALPSLKKNPYMRMSTNNYGNFIDWKYEGYVDEWVYPGKESLLTGERQNQLGSDNFIGVWKRGSWQTDTFTFGPDYKNGGCPGDCCEEPGTDKCCKECALVSRTAKYSDLYGRPGGWGCANDRDCYGGPPKYNNQHPEGYCGYGGRRRGEYNRLCCRDKAAHTSYGFSGGWCDNSPSGWPCDNEDSQCASGSCVSGTPDAIIQGAQVAGAGGGRRWDGGSRCA